jgi:hypothetical protein
LIHVGEGIIINDEIDYKDSNFILISDDENASNYFSNNFEQNYFCLNWDQFMNIIFPLYLNSNLF